MKFKTFIDLNGIKSSYLGTANFRVGIIHRPWIVNPPAGYSWWKKYIYCGLVDYKTYQIRILWFAAGARFV